MEISLTAETRRRLAEHVIRDGFGSADELIQFALDTLEREVEGEAIEDLDPETQAAIARGEEQLARGEGRPWAEVKEDLRALFKKG